MFPRKRTQQEMQAGTRPSHRRAARPETGTDRWLRLADRFFEAATTEEEELALRRFLLTPEGQDARFDELRAYMAFAACGRTVAAASQPAVPTKRFGLRPAVRWAAAAVLVAGMALPATLRLVHGTDEVCVAYIGGRRVTEREAVLSHIHGVMEDVVAQDGDFSMEQQLGDMFETLEDAADTASDER